MNGEHGRNVGPGPPPPPPVSHPMGLQSGGQTPWQAHYARYPPNRPPPMPREGEQHHMPYHGAPPPPINLPPPQMRLVQGKYSKIKKKRDGKVHNIIYFFFSRVLNGGLISKAFFYRGTRLHLLVVKNFFNSVIFVPSLCCVFPFLVLLTCPRSKFIVGVQLSKECNLL